jgi:hypothetical protein
METIIENLKNQIQQCKKYRQDMNEASWSYETGVLISANEAKFIIDLLVAHEKYRGLHGIENDKNATKISKEIRSIENKFNSLAANKK